MRQITVLETQNGCLVVDGNSAGMAAPYLIDASWSFDSVDAAIDEIRRLLDSWCETAELAGEDVTP